MDPSAIFNCAISATRHYTRSTSHATLVGLVTSCWAARNISARSARTQPSQAERQSEIDVANFRLPPPPPPPPPAPPSKRYYIRAARAQSKIYRYRYPRRLVVETETHEAHCGNVLMMHTYRPAIHYTITSRASELDDVDDYDSKRERDRDVPNLDLRSPRARGAVVIYTYNLLRLYIIRPQRVCVVQGLNCYQCGQYNDGVGSITPCINYTATQLKECPKTSEYCIVQSSQKPVQRSKADAHWNERKRKSNEAAAAVWLSAKHRFACAAQFNRRNISQKSSAFPVDVYAIKHTDTGSRNRVLLQRIRGAALSKHNLIVRCSCRGNPRGALISTERKNINYTCVSSAPLARVRNPISMRCATAAAAAAALYRKHDNGIVTTLKPLSCTNFPKKGYVFDFWRLKIQTLDDGFAKASDVSAKSSAIRKRIAHQVDYNATSVLRVPACGRSPPAFGYTSGAAHITERWKGKVSILRGAGIKFPAARINQTAFKLLEMENSDCHRQRNFSATAVYMCRGTRSTSSESFSTRELSGGDRSEKTMTTILALNACSGTFFAATLDRKEDDFWRTARLERAMRPLDEETGNRLQGHRGLLHLSALRHRHTRVGDLLRWCDLQRLEPPDRPEASPVLLEILRAQGDIRPRGCRRRPPRGHPTRGRPDSSDRLRQRPEMSISARHTAGIDRRGSRRVRAPARRSRGHGHHRPVVGQHGQSQGHTALVRQSAEDGRHLRLQSLRRRRVVVLHPALDNLHRLSLSPALQLRHENHSLEFSP
ncbi:unnamed protein product [Trichogramma brassicae]|uniref:Uncharacterized protein n=1 Tax=Trichogramma brassicae TaxID=86971 RepID=A0A6H5HVE5_9HYME|nr:unnamed protein product [Trichogramma brassicae]